MPEQNNSGSFNENSPSVQTHLGILQGIIQRMAANSAGCKTWCITTVSAILVIILNKDNKFSAWIAIFPAFMFFVLDVYYLALEKGFRDSYKVFIDKLHTGKLEIEDLYSVVPSKTNFFWQSVKSISIWGFYLWIFALVVFMGLYLKK